VVNLGGYR